MVCRSTDSDIYYAQTSGKDYLVMDLGFISVVDKWTDWSYPYSNIIYLVYEKVISLGEKERTMDTVEFLKEKHRMCQGLSVCRRCYELIYSNLGLSGYSVCGLINTGKYKEAVEIVEKWSKEHPKITNGMKFEEVFGFKISRSNESGDYLYLPENWLDQEYKPQEKNTDE